MKKLFQLKKIEFAAVFGTGELGAALIDKILERNPHVYIFAIKRKESSFSHIFKRVHVIDHDPLSESSWEKLVSDMKKVTERLDQVISTYGLLHNENIAPEKSLKDIELNSMIESFQVNAMTAPLLAKYLYPFFSKKTPSCMSFLSAKVGSIGDNRLGGWYSYRASKAAMNMFVKNIAIEFERKKLQTSVMSIHPGTTESKLSKPYLKNFNLKVWKPDQSAEHILDVIEKNYGLGVGLFKNWDDSNLPW